MHPKLKGRGKKIFWFILLLWGIRLIYLSLYYYGVSSAHPISSLKENSYYIKFDYLKESKAINLDSNLVSFVDYSKIKSLGVKNTISYNPVTIGFQGLRYHQKFMEGKNVKDSITFLAHANWLNSNITSNGEWIIPHNKKIEDYTLKTPWISSLSQGFGISVLIRAYKITGNIKYLNSARLAIKPFQKTIENGGIKYDLEDGAFYEEYPIKTPDHVLNGFIYSLFGLYDLYSVDNNIEAKFLFDQGIKALIKNLAFYDAGNWSLYSLNKQSNLKNHWNYSSPFYQDIHVAQLKGLYLITKNPIFLEYQKRFKKQNDSGYINYIIYPAYVIYADFVKIYKIFWN